MHYACRLSVVPCPALRGTARHPTTCTNQLISDTWNHIVHRFGEHLVGLHRVEKVRVRLLEVGSSRVSGVRLGAEICFVPNRVGVAAPDIGAVGKAAVVLPAFGRLSSTALAGSAGVSLWLGGWGGFGSGDEGYDRGCEGCEDRLTGWVSGRSGAVDALCSGVFYGGYRLWCRFRGSGAVGSALWFRYGLATSQGWVEWVRIRFW